MKLDFEKAYDNANHGFLDQIMESMAFGVKWRGWIRACMSPPKISVLINGSPRLINFT